jgi:hypothetical protein
VSKTRRENEHEFLDHIRFSRDLSLWQAMSRASGLLCLSALNTPTSQFVKRYHKPILG